MLLAKCFSFYKHSLGQIHPIDVSFLAYCVSQIHQIPAGPAPNLKHTLAQLEIQLPNCSAPNPNWQPKDPVKQAIVPGNKVVSLSNEGKLGVFPV
jgi:hypothetical protein